MSKKQVIPTEFPVEIDDKVHFVKKGDYAKSVSSQMAIALKADIKSDHVKQMLDALEKKGASAELPGDAPEELVKVWERVKEDWDSAIAEVERKEQEEEDKKIKAAEEEKARQEAEQELFISVKDETTDLGTLAKLFDTGGGNMNQFTPKGKVTDEALFAAFNASLGMSNFTNWMTGDLVNELEDRGHLNVVSKLSEDRGVSFKSIYKMAKTARVIKPEQRVNGVSFSVYAEIANARFSDKKGAEGDKEHGEKLALLVEKANELDEKGKGKLNTQTARDEVKKAQGKSITPPPTKLPEEDENFVFLVIDTRAEQGQEVVTVKGFPKALHTEGAIVVNPKTLKKFALNGFKKAAENRWEEVAAYAPPAPAAKPAPKKKK